MKWLQAFYIVLVCLLTLIGVAFLVTSYGENVETARAVHQHHIAPSAATRQKLAEVNAANERAMIIPGCILAVFFIGSVFVILRSTRGLRVRNI